VLGAEILYVTAVNMYKISLLFLYFRIFPVRSIRLGSYICGGLSTAWNLACIFAAIFQCTPRERLWYPWLEGTCINLFLTQLCISVPSIMCDIAILCLPIPHVWRLKTNMTQRIFLIGIFLLGSYVVFTSIYRFKVYLGYNNDDVPCKFYSRHPSAALRDTGGEMLTVGRPDTLADGCAWNVIEISSGIVSSCLPTLGTLVRIIFTSLYPTTRSSGDRGYPPGSGAHKRSQTVTIGGGGGPDHRASSHRWDASGDKSRDRDDNKYGVHMDHAYGGYRGKVMTTVSHGHVTSSISDSNDDIPLMGIRQQTHVEVSEDRVESRGTGSMTSAEEGKRAKVK
jgi:hypothetical protein